MWLSNRFLSKCLQRNEPARLRPGTVVCRGFADLGAEAFCVLTNQSAVSLLTGDRAQFAEHERKHLREVPDCDQAANLLWQAGWSIVACEPIDQRDWRVRLRGEDGQEVSFEGSTLREAFVEALLETSSPGESHSR